MSPIPVLLSCDLNYLQHAAVCIASLATNNRSLQFHIIIASAQELDLDEEKLTLTVAHLNNISLEFVKLDLLTKLHLPLHN